MVKPETVCSYTPPVRKRLVIGAIAAVVIGVAAYVLSAWHPDTIEYHAKSYLKVRELSDRERWVVEKAPAWAGRLMIKRKAARLERHRNALIRQHFLQEINVAVSNASARDVIDNLLASGFVSSEYVEGKFLNWEAANTNVIRVVTVPRDVEIWTELIRKADVPETK
jgi:hypothetical protein